jgi:hypothetical protein
MFRDFLDKFQERVLEAILRSRHRITTAINFPLQKPHCMHFGEFFICERVAHFDYDHTATQSNISLESV